MNAAKRSETEREHVVEETRPGSRSDSWPGADGSDNPSDAVSRSRDARSVSDAAGGRCSARSRSATRSKTPRGERPKRSAHSRRALAVASKRSAASVSRLPVAVPCDNCRRIVTPVRRVTLLVDDTIVRERSMCTACLCNWRELIQQPAPWLGTRISRSGAA